MSNPQLHWQDQHELSSLINSTMNALINYGHSGHVTHGGFTDPTAPDVLGRFRAHHFMIGQCSHEKVAQNGMGTRLAQPIHFLREPRRFSKKMPFPYATRGSLSSGFPYFLTLGPNSDQRSAALDRILTHGAHIDHLRIAQSYVRKEPLALGRLCD